MLKVVDLLILVLDLCLQITFLSLRLRHHLCLLHDFILELLSIGLLFLRLLLRLIFLCFPLLLIPRLHFRLLNKHLFLDLVDFLLFFDLHLVDHSPVLFSELLYIIHELLVGLLTFLKCLFEATALLLEKIDVHLLLLELL